MRNNMDEKFNIDRKDLMLIEELRNDAKLSEQKMARKTGIPMTTVHNRIRKLRGLGVITGYTVRLDYAKLGRPMTAYVLVKAAPGADHGELLSDIAKIPHVCEAATVAGDFDIFFKARFASMNEMSRVVVHGLRMKKAVGDARVMLSYETMQVE